MAADVLPSPRTPLAERAASPALCSRRQCLLSLAALGMGASPLAQANTPASSLSSALQGQQRVGRARLRVWGFEVYDAQLWAAEGFDPERFAEHRFALELSYLRNFEGADIAERSIQEMRGIGSFSDAQAQRWQAEMAQVFPNVQRGDRITGVYAPRGNARFYFNDALRGEITDPVFAPLFFGIWLSPRSSQPRMRQTLLQAFATPKATP